MIDQHHRWNVSLKPLFLGFVLSLLLIAAIFLFVVKHHLTGSVLVLTLFGLSFLQAIFQLVFFLHVGMESKPHWNSITMAFTVLVIVIVIGGSLWIMQNLSYNVMPAMHHGSP